MADMDASNHKLLVGLIGAGIQQSLTPALHEEEAARQGLKLHYQLIDLDLCHLDLSATKENSEPAASALPTLLSAARMMGFAGLNITYPCKQLVMPLLDGLSDEARAIGAVNTVVVQGGRLTGHNTDGSGWTWGFQRALPAADLSRVVLLGAGGAGSAIAHAVLSLGCGELRIVDNDAARAGALAQRLKQQHPAADVRGGDDVGGAMAGATGLVHATPTGMDKLPGMPLPAALLQPSMWVSEIVYFPLHTALLQAARDRGCHVADGGGMAVGQAVSAFELFTGRPADAARMDAHFRRLIADRH